MRGYYAPTRNLPQQLKILSAKQLTCGCTDRIMCQHTEKILYYSERTIYRQENLYFSVRKATRQSNYIFSVSLSRPVRENKWHTGIK